MKRERERRRRSKREEEEEVEKRERGGGRRERRRRRPKRDGKERNLSRVQCAAIVSPLSCLTLAMNWMSFTKMLSGMSFGCTPLCPLGNSVSTILRRRLEKEGMEGRRGWRGWREGGDGGSMRIR